MLPKLRTLFLGGQKQLIFQKENIKMTRAPELVRDFIHDCWYNKEYGYFMKNINILETLPQAAEEKSFASSLYFKAMQDEEDYQMQLSRLYHQSDTRLQNPNHQLWHTPSSLFNVFAS